MKPRTVDIDWIDEIYTTPDPSSEPGEDCPDLCRLRAAAAAELPLEERCAILDHALGCRYCAESWRLALHLGARPQISLWYQFLSIVWADLRFLFELPGKLARSAPGRALTSHLDALWPRTQPARLVAISTVTVMALGVAYVVSGPAPLQRVAHRGGMVKSPGSRGAAAVTSLVRDGERLPREDFVLRWSGPRRAVYDVQVLRQDGEPVASAKELTATEYRVPEEQLRSIESGAVLTWRVSYRTDGGHRIEAPEVRVRLKSEFRVRLE